MVRVTGRIVVLVICRVKVRLESGLGLVLDVNLQIELVRVKFRVKGYGLRRSSGEADLA